MSTATLTSVLNSGSTYTSLAVTAMPDGGVAGETVWVSLGLAAVEGFKASADFAVGATSIAVTSQKSANAHAIGDPVAPNHTLTAVGRESSPMAAPRGHRI